MKYFIVSDVHGHYDILRKTLKENGFDEKNREHVLVVAGDLFDRGRQPNEIIKYVNDLYENNFIYIRGNHEDLLERCVNELKTKGTVNSAHFQNGTMQTISDYFGLESPYQIFYNLQEILDNVQPLLDFINKSIDYFEIGNYIVTHGWIPSTLAVSKSDPYKDIYVYKPDWRNASKEDWDKARWLNGMKLAYEGNIEEDKTIICGHIHTGFGNFNYHGKGKDQYDVLDIYKNEGIIALDAGTAYSGKMNCFVIDTANDTV